MSERLEAARRELCEAIRAARTTMEDVRRGAGGPATPKVVITGRDQGDARADG
jgi:hypothetical protein